MKGSRQLVLMERGGIGHTPCFASVAFAGALPGVFVPLTITGRAGPHLTGVVQ
jgi:threonylcarbamoyladenosine tRNA methylthiotransferase MtaB